MRRQIVFDQIWQIDSTFKPITLRAETFSGRDLIRDFVHPRITGGRTARLILEELVPVSGHRTTRTVQDLTKHGPPDEVTRVLEELDKQKILRRDAQGGYAVYHDAIQDAVRTWCRKALEDEPTQAVEVEDLSGRTQSRIEELERALKKAEKSSRAAAVREMSARALLLLAHDQQRSIMLALEALTAIKSSDDADGEAGDYLFRYLVQTGQISDARTTETLGQRAEIRDDGSIDVLEVRAGGSRLWKALPSIGAGVVGIVMSPDGSRLATKLETGDVRVWDLRTGKEMLAGEPGATPLRSSEIREILRRVRAIVGLREPTAAVPAGEPDLQFISRENQEAFHVDAIRE